MAGPQQFPDEVRDRLIAAVCDEGLGPKQAWRMAGAGELDGWDPAWPVPSFTTIRDWRKLEERARSERRIMDREKPIGDVVDDMLRRALKLCDRDLKRLENTGSGPVDYAAMARMLKVVKEVAQATGAEPKRTRSDKKPEDEKVGTSAVLNAVQQVQAASRAENANTQETKTGTSNTTHHKPTNEQEEGRRHLVTRAEEMARQRMEAMPAVNGSSST